MWNDRLRLAQRVEKDFERLSGSEKDLVRAALEKIDDDPIVGAPLFEPLRGYWTFRTDAFRIIYRIISEAQKVLILKIARAAEPRS